MKYLYLSFSEDDQDKIQQFLETIRKEYRIEVSGVLSDNGNRLDDVNPVCFIPFISFSYNESPACKKEIYSALSNDIPVLPVALEMDSLKDGMWLRFSHLKQLDFYAEDFCNRFKEIDLVKACLISGSSDVSENDSNDVTPGDRLANPDNPINESRKAVALSEDVVEKPAPEGREEASIVEPDSVEISIENIGLAESIDDENAESETSASEERESAETSETDILDDISIETINYPDGSVYQGSVVDGIRSGHGRLDISDGRVYKGMWKNDKYEGEGVFTWPDGSKYEGEWENGVFSGKGTRIYHDGDKYEGEWRKGKFHGQGVYTWKDGSVYEGEWSHDHFTGEGKFIWPDGAVFTGRYQAGVRDGKGEMKYPDGTILLGEWQNGVFKENEHHG